MNRSLAIVALLLLPCSAVQLSAAEPDEQEIVPIPLDELDTNRVPRLWFPVGEELVYRLKWGIFPIGESRVSSDWVKRGEDILLRIRYRTLTNSLFDKIYPMNDSAESIIDPETFLPTKFTFRKARRRPMCDETIDFDHDAGIAHASSRCTNSDKTIEIEPSTQDIITFMYGMRRHKLEVGTNLTVNVMGNEGLVELKLETRKGRKIDLPIYGKVDSIEVVPEVELKTMLVEDGKVRMFVSKDERCVATRLIVDAPLANVRALLTRVNGPGDDTYTEANEKADAD